MKPNDSRHVRISSYVLLACLVAMVRGLTGYLAFDSLASDPDNYAELAEQISTHGVYGFRRDDGSTPTPTAFRPPLYPLLLSMVVFDGRISQVGVCLIHVVIGVATALLTYSIGRRLTLRFAWIAAVLVTLDPILIRQAQQVMTESLATLSSVVVWRVWLMAWPTSSIVSKEVGSCPTHRARNWIQWSSIVLLGISFGLSILVRPTAAPWAFICVVAVGLFQADCWKRRMADAVVVGAVTLATLAPWTLRNLEHFGAPIWATTHGGYTLLLANNPSLYKHFLQHGPSRNWDDRDFQDAWRRVPIETAHASLEDAFWNSPADNTPTTTERIEPLRMEHSSVVAASPQQQEMELDNRAYRLAWNTIADRPGTFALSSFYRIGWLWALWPNTTSTKGNIVVGVWYCIVLSLASFGFVAILKRKVIFPWVPALVLALSLTLIHGIFWSNMRMRAPVMPAVCLLVAVVVEQIRNRSAT